MFLYGQNLSSYHYLILSSYLSSYLYIYIYICVCDVQLCSQIPTVSPDFVHPPVIFPICIVPDCLPHGPPPEPPLHESLQVMEAHGKVGLLMPKPWKFFEHIVVQWYQVVYLHNIYIYICVCVWYLCKYNIYLHLYVYI